MELNFDMDGTLVDLYGVENWLDKLIASDPTPYIVAKPIVNLNVVARLLNKLQAKGCFLRIITWTSKGGSEDYNTQVGYAKLGWLKRHMPSVHWDEVCIVDYGTPKSSCGNGILFDDEDKNLNEWKDIAVNAKDMINYLKGLK